MSWTLLGYGVYAACQWGMLVALAKIGSPEMVGQFALGLAITAPVMMFASLKMRIVQATDAKGEFQFSDYFSVRVLTTALAFLVVAGIALLANYSGGTVMVILAIGLAKSFESISDIFHGLFQFNERMDRVAVSLMLKGPLSLAALVALVCLTGSVFWGAVGLAATWAILLLAYDARMGRRTLRDSTSLSGSILAVKEGQSSLHRSWDWKNLRSLLWFGLPLGFVVTLNSLDTNIPRYFVEGYFGEAAIGIFAALAYLERVGSTVVKALGESASPRMARYYASRERKAFLVLFLELIGLGLLLGVAGILISLVAGQRILTLLYSAEYARGEVFLALMIASGLGYISSFIIFGVSAARIFNIQLLLEALVTGSLVCACVLMVPRGGLLGAANALVFARVIQLAGSAVLATFAIVELHRPTQMAQRIVGRVSCPPEVSAFTDSEK